VRKRNKVLAEDYEEYFEDKLDEYDVDSPADIPEDKKDDFFEDVDEGYESEEEKAEGINKLSIVSWTLRKK